MHPETFLRVLGPEPWNVAYVQPSRRPADGRYGDNPNRLYKHHQLQVILKPPPHDIQDLYLESLIAPAASIPREHDIRFEEDNWESPTLGAWGIGWQVLLDGLEISQFTYFQQAGASSSLPSRARSPTGSSASTCTSRTSTTSTTSSGRPACPTAAVRHRDEVEGSRFSFDAANVELTRSGFHFHARRGLSAARRKASCSPPTSTASSARTCSTRSTPGGRSR